MPLGIVRQDLNADGVSFRHGNPVPATSASYDSNPVTWVASPTHFGNAVNTATIKFGNVVNWAKAPAHFGNVIA